MKKTSLFFVAIFSFLTILSSSAFAQKLPTDVDIDGLHGKVKRVMKITYEARTDFEGITSEGDILERIETNYNAKGWRKTITYYTPEASINFRSRFRHDGFGLATVEQIVDPNENIIGRTYYSYNANNTLKEMWIEDAERQIESRTLYRFDAQGKMTQRTLCDADGNIYKREVFGYVDGLAVSRTVYDRKGNKMQECFYEYDENGEPISTSLFDYSEEEPELTITSIEYSYDDNGNWIRRVESEIIDDKSVMQSIITREIEYYQ